MRTSIIFRRARFNRRNQLEGQLIEQYVTVLRNLAEMCGYHKLKNETIRNHNMVEIRDIELFKKLQMEKELTLQKAMRIVRQKEQLKNSKEPSMVMAARETR